MSLYEKYRPTSLKDFIGNEDLKRDLRPFIRGSRPLPTAMLFTGGSGMGKTTCARMLAKLCKISDLTELDTADFRGIDSIREIRRQMQLSPLTGSARGWILDECFAKGTPINTPGGSVPIEKVQKGDAAYSAVGLDHVINTFANKVALSRLCYVMTKFGVSLVCTVEHAFFTQEYGWKDAASLKGAHVFQLPMYGDYVWPEGLHPAQSQIEDGLDSIDPEVQSRLVPVMVDDVIFFADHPSHPIWASVLDAGDRDRGYATFYDLEMEKHHSYFANGVLVHNCHKLTNDAQNALLKALESPPAGVHFFLCTTDPQMLIKTILTRCTQFQVEALSRNELMQVMQIACVGEGKEIPDSVLTVLAKQADGSPRAALSLLERVMGRNPDDYDKEVSCQQDFESQIKDLCQALLRKVSWKEVATILRGLKEEPESVRWAVLGYMNAVLLSGKDSARAALIIDAFKDPYFNTKAAGLTLSCYSALS